MTPQGRDLIDACWRAGIPSHAAPESPASASTGAVRGSRA